MFLLSLQFFLFFFPGTASDPICFQLPVEDDVSPLPVRYVLHMQTPKHPAVSPLSSHLLPLVLPLSAKSRVIHLQCTGGRPQGSAA